MKKKQTSRPARRTRKAKSGVAPSLGIRGRPRKFATADELAVAIEVYLYECASRTKEKRIVGEDGKMQTVCEADPKHPTVAGLCLSLGFASRSTLSDYAKRGSEFSNIIKRTHLYFEDYLNELMLNAKSPTACIFSLKCHHQWREDGPDPLDDTDDDGKPRYGIIRMPLERTFKESEIIDIDEVEG